ncbi:MAG: hypothetical protein HKN43_08425 [Rhodothermales bacterium]|nr:hypothetical protein [Rhodothermales bacterium]
MHKHFPILVAFLILPTMCFGQDMNPRGDYSEHLYRVTLLRAAPGGLATLVDESRSYKQSMDGNVVIMRHSQGDHWDLMFLEPFDNNILNRRDWRVSFQDDLIASSDWNWQRIKEAAASAGLFHIEMFQAAAGLENALLREREMENEYLEATGRNGNAIFVTRFGSDVDNFTIGFYPDMVTYATDPDLPDEVYHKAATDAGFASRSDIGFFLRQFIVGHNDTLASQVR